MEADEVTYSLHVVLRWELERELFSGALAVRQLPDAWNEKMRLYLDTVPQHASQGCLQDSHWPMGYFGYFSTYMMGIVIAAQLHGVVQHDIPDIAKRIRAGDFAPLFEWLQQHIYSEACRLTSDDLVHQATGTTANPDHLLAYLRGKYLHE